MSLRLALGAASAFVLAAALTFGAAIYKDRERLQNLATAHQACEDAVAGKAKTRPVAEVCTRPIADLHRAAFAAAACDQALGKLDLFAIRTSCSTAVKDLFADRQTKADRVETLTGELGRLRLDQAAAIARAEARARTQAEQKAKADAAIAAAPVRADGLRVCAAECVRDVTGGTIGPAAQP